MERGALDRGPRRLLQELPEFPKLFLHQGALLRGMASRSSRKSLSPTSRYQGLGAFSFLRASRTLALSSRKESPALASSRRARLRASSRTFLSSRAAV